jgi:hypothetical protein
VEPRHGEPYHQIEPVSVLDLRHSNITKKSKDDWNSPATILLDSARHEKKKVVANGIHAAHWKPA